MEQETEFPGVIIMTHGALCEALIESTTMIYGPMERVLALPLLVGANADDYMQALEAQLDAFNNNALILVDIVGGTPLNTVIKVGQHRPLYAVAGANMPMLLEVLDQRVLTAT